MSPTAPRGLNVRANGIRQHALRYAGGGQPLVIVPGITSPAITWGFVAERFAQVYDTYVIDVRGRGLSASGPGLDYGLDALAADLAALIGALGLIQPVVVGHSMGARIAARATARRDADPSHLLLVDPPVSGPGRRPYPSQLPWYTGSIRLATEGMDAEAMKAFCPTWTEEQRALRAEWLHTCYAPAIVTAFDGFHADDFHADLPGLHVPTALVVAGRGGVIQAEDEAEIHVLNPKIETVRVPNAGHMIPWDDFDGFFRAVDQVLGTSFYEVSHEP